MAKTIVSNGEGGVRFVDKNGKEWEWGRNQYRIPSPGDYFLSDTGEIWQLESRDTAWGSVRAVVHPVAAKYKLGNLTFEETGEYRPVKPGEFYLLHEIPHLWDMLFSTTDSCKILRLVKEGG